jgi:hypothetical protein
MNHTKNLATAVGMLAIVVTLTGAVAVSVLLPAAHAAAVPMTKDPKDPRNSIDYENSETDFSFKQKLKNNCSGFATCDNIGLEQLGGPIAVPTP